MAPCAGQATHLALVSNLAGALRATTELHGDSTMLREAIDLTRPVVTDLAFAENIVRAGQAA